MEQSETSDLVLWSALAISGGSLIKKVLRIWTAMQPEMRLNVNSSKTYTLQANLISGTSSATSWSRSAVSFSPFSSGVR
eukprot:5570102-Amphidinium_carterae.1